MSPRRTSLAVIFTNTTLANKVEYIDPYGNVDRRAFIRTVEETGRLGAFLGDSGERER